MITMEELGKIIKSLIISNKNPLSIEHLQRDFEESEGYSIPKMSYVDTEDLLRRGLNDAVTVLGHGPKAILIPVVSEKNQHIHRMVVEQRAVKIRRPQKLFRSRRNSNNQPKDFSKTRAHGKYEKYSSYGRTNDSFNSRNEPVNKSNCTNKSNYDSWRSKPQTNTSAYDQNADKMSWDSGYKTNTSSQSNKIVLSPSKNIEKWTRKISNNIPLRNTEDENSFKRMVNSFLNTSLNTKQQNSKTTETPTPLFACLKQNGSIKSENLDDSNEDSQVSVLSTLSVRQAQKELETAGTAGTENESFELNDINIKDRSIVNENLNFDRIESQSNSDSDNLDSSESTIVNLNLSLPPLIFPFNKDSSINEQGLDDALPDFAINKRVFMADFPEHAVPFGVEIVPFEMPNSIKVDSVISIYISEIHNPYRFWFHLGNEDSPLDDLMYNIELFYDRSDVIREYSFLTEHIQSGQLCVASYNGLWHRAKILSTVSDNKIKVFYLDYGTVEDVTKDDIKYLHKEFAELPAAACRGSLAEINPVRLHWSLEATTAFLTMSKDRKLHAKVCEIDVEDSVYYLSICDTHLAPPILINYELIKMKHAIQCYDWKNSKLNGTPRLRHKREDYPTFDMLETGEYPTFVEIYNLKAHGIDYEEMTDKMIYYPHIVNLKDGKLHSLPFHLLANNPFKQDIEKELSIEENDL